MEGRLYYERYQDYTLTSPENGSIIYYIRTRIRLFLNFTFKR